MFNFDKDCDCVSSKIVFDETFRRYFEIYSSLVDTTLDNPYKN